MATIPPVRTIRDRVKTVAQQAAEWLNRQPHTIPQWSHTEQSMAVWLRGNDHALKTLKDLITERSEARMKLPIPGVPHDLAVYEGRNREDREIIAALVKIHAAPLEFGSDGDGNE